MNLANKRIIISKTNQIGDVTVALPLASFLKELEPSCHIIFLSREYTRSLIGYYKDVDQFADWESMSAAGEDHAVAQLQNLHADIILQVLPYKPIARAAYKAGIPTRIGNGRRVFNWIYCNKLVFVARKKSPLHETQMDMLYLQAFTGRKKIYSKQEIINNTHYKPIPKTSSFLSLLDPTKFNLILHPKTRGEHIEWWPAHFATLIKMLPRDQFKVFVTGSPKEREEVGPTMLDPYPFVTDLMGKLSLNDLMEFIAHADGLIAASTGPVHLAANFGIFTLGLYAPIKPFDATRWGPVGRKAEILSLPNACYDCRFTKCHCVNEITPPHVFDVMCRWYYSKFSRRSEKSAVPELEMETC